MRKQTAILTMLCLLATAPAMGEAPTSQFGFSGWPYRQQTDCVIPESTLSPTDRPEYAPESTISPTKQPVIATQEPVIPTSSPVAPTKSPTAAPTAVVTPRPTAQPTKAPSTDEDYTTDSLTVQEQKAWNLLNQDRKNNGLPTLSIDPTLSAIARRKSEDMRDKGYFAHQSPTYGSASDMLKHFGYSFKAVGENIAHHATVEKSQAAFMSSDGHRRNILSSSWTKVGIGVCYDKNGFVYVTQLFVR